MTIIPVDQTRELLPLPILKEILQTGLTITGGKGGGKSTTAKTLVAEIIKSATLHKIDIQCKIFDTACNWRWGFEPILFQEILPETRYIYGGQKHILYDMDLDDDEILNFIQKTAYNDYLKQREIKKQFQGDRTRFGWKLYCIEEAQSSLSSHALRRKTGKKAQKLIAEGRNFNQCFIIIGQRLAEMSTAFVERMHGLMIAKMTGDNDLAKLKRKVGKHSTIIDEVQKLQVGQFIYWNGKSGYKFNCPDYTSTTIPTEWKPKLSELPVWEHFCGERLM